METKQTIPCLDVELLQGYLDSLGQHIVEQMFTLFCQQVEIYLKDIAQAQLNDSVKDWEENCHKMKGAAASVGMTYLYSQLKVLEKTSADKQEKAAMLAELKAVNSQAITAFKTWLGSC